MRLGLNRGPHPIVEQGDRVGRQIQAAPALDARACDPRARHEGAMDRVVGNQRRRAQPGALSAISAGALSPAQAAP